MTKIGAFEEYVLLAVGVLHEGAYGVAIKELIEEKTGKRPSIGALHSALYRLEDKGCLKSWEGGATASRGGRRKKFYSLTATGTKCLRDAQQVRMQFAKDIPDLNLGYE